MKEVLAEIEVFAAILDRTPKYVDRHDSNEDLGHATETGLGSQDPSFSDGFDKPRLNPADHLDLELDNESIRATASSERLENATRRVEKLEQAHELARAELSRVQQQERDVPDRLHGLWFVRARVDARAESADAIGGGFPLSRVFVMLGVALAVGAVVFTFTPRQASDRVLRRVVDVEERVGLPVVGAISSSSKSGSPPTRPSSRRGVFRLLVAAAEFVVIAVVVVFLVSTLLDRQLAAAYLDDPFATLGETLKAATQRLLPR
jgi:hypothetical protein